MIRVCRRVGTVEHIRTCCAGLEHAKGPVIVAEEGVTEVVGEVMHSTGRFGDQLPRRHEVAFSPGSRHTGASRRSRANKGYGLCCSAATGSRSPIASTARRHLPPKLTLAIVADRNSFGDKGLLVCRASKAWKRMLEGGEDVR